jgi:hypothetical protein
MLDNTLIEQMKLDLTTNVMNVTFTKVDGTVRVMRCTLKEESLPVGLKIDALLPKKTNDAILCVWDLDNNGWRSFRKDAVTAVEVVQ